MIKKNKWLLIITSLVILIPIIAGLFLWDKLPEKIAIHWNAEGTADGFAGKTFAVLGMPLILLAIHIVCTLVTGTDPKNKNISGKPLALVLWICPVMSLLVGTIVYGTALGYMLSVEIIMPFVLGAMFVVVGNYMPKCRQNYTIGIKVPWTLNDEENWNKTHRFAGILWVLGGVAVMATAFLGSVYIMLSVVLLMAFAPMVYSYVIYKKKK